jgi:hypothetical protein
VFAAAQVLAFGGLRQPGCARAALEALLSGDTVAAAAREPYRFGSLVTLQGILVATGRDREVEQLLERDTVFNTEYRGQLYLLAALADSFFAPEAERYAAELRARYAADPGGMPSRQLWFLGTWDWARDRGAEAAGLARRMLEHATGPDARRDSLLARSLLARATLARGDTVAAIQQLAALEPTTASDQDLTWNPWESLGDERLLLARLLLARGRAAEALAVASNFDSPVPMSYIMYLPASLALRVDAAERLGDTRVARNAAERLAQLRGHDGR